MTSNSTLRMETNRGSRNRRTSNDRKGLGIIRRRQNVTGRISHVDRRCSNWNARERVITIGISGCGAGDTKSISQRNGATSEITIGTVLGSIVVGIGEHMTRNNALRLETNRSSSSRSAHRNNHALRIIRRGQRVASGIRHIHSRRTNRNTRECVITVCIGSRGASNTKRISQRNRKPTEICFTSGLRSVAIGIREHMSRNRALWLETNRSSSSRSAHRNNHALRIIRCGQHIASGIGYVHRRRSSRNTRKRIVTSCISSCCASNTKRISQRNGQTAQVNITRTLQRIAVGIREHMTSNRATRLETNRGSCSQSANRNNNVLWIICCRKNGTRWIRYVHR